MNRLAMARAVAAPVRLAYALWTAAAFLTVGIAALMVLAVLPGVGRRRAAGRALARAFLRIAGMPVQVRFPERLPGDQCVVVCNHASYLDGIVLTAALPPRFGFVIKREMASVPLAGLALRRLGSEFVERFDRHRGAADTRRLLRSADNGRSLMFFPEGTFTRSPGLLKFHTGAFMTAARVGCPVVPAVLRGTRRALPPGGFLPRAGPLELELLTPITSAVQSPDHAAPDLRDRSRAAILASLGEPDLTCSGDTARPPDRARAKSARAS